MKTRCLFRFLAGFIFFAFTFVLIYNWDIFYYLKQSNVNITSIGGINFSPIKIIVSDNTNVRYSFHNNQNDPYISMGAEDFPYPLSVDMLDLVQKIKKNLTIGISPINNFEFKYLINNAHGCVPSGSRKTDLIILIKSAPFNRKSRDLIRETWGRENCWMGLNTRRFFLIGTSPAYNEEIANESIRFHDIVQQEFLDNYYNNTYKLVMGFHWALTFCPTAKDILFVDDDYFVHPKNVINYLQSLSVAYRQRHIAGMVYSNSKPFRSSEGFYGKWNVDMSDYPWDSYPPYLAAGTIFISNNLLRDIFIAMQYTLYFRFDDIFLGIVLHKLLITPVHLKNVYSEKSVPLDNRAVYKNVFTSHGFKSRKLMLNIWKDLKCENLCSK